jgi:uncharacterized protein (DUF302 family)
MTDLIPWQPHPSYGILDHNIALALVLPIELAVAGQKQHHTFCSIG